MTNRNGGIMDNEEYEKLEKEKAIHRLHNSIENRLGYTKITDINKLIKIVKMLEIHSTIRAKYQSFKNEFENDKMYQDMDITQE